MSINIGGGMNFRFKQNWICKLCSDHAISVLGVQETKLSIPNHASFKAFWGNFQFQFASSGSSGRPGGILTMWDPNVFMKSRVISFDSIFIVEGVFSGIPTPCFIINVYAPQSRSRKKRLWEYITNFMNSNAGNFIIFGDFNVIHFSHERFGCHFNHLESADFDSFISSNSLIDFSLGGREFTRFNKSFTHRAKLDRFLATDGFVDAFPSLSGTILSNIWSDHCPIILKNVTHDYGPIPFKLFHSWFKIEGFEDTVINAWNSYQLPYPSSLKVDLSKRLAALDTDFDANLPFGNLAIERTSILKDLACVELVEQANLAQKHRKMFYCLGDENSSFFYSAINKKRKIPGIMFNGDWIT
ncbi:uncharacterized protein [Rutidosis leptorrhynchoides]|uniref:uncharacterized protein n=1 Tax=Rutidosis leptorrhynchoides TaxID=125765 RepID=UPI003A98E4C0